MPAADQVEAILGADPKIDALRAQIRRLAAFDTPGNPHAPTVLLLGETGTGKGLLARVMHANGPRAAGPFVDVNCAAIPESMLEAELFGFEAGAFTDAKRTKPGLFETSSGGTLFLDEIDSLSPAVQGKVLKAIEDKQARRLGGVASRQLDLKLIAATQADLLDLAARGRFRADLYHRLAVVLLHIPPLRQRPGDIVLLADAFLRTYADAHRLPPKRLGPDALAWLRAHPFPGNVRELGHLMERVVLLGPDGDVTAASLRELSVPIAPALGAEVPTAGDAAPPPADEVARIREALARTGGNVVRAAALLGLGRNALRYRMRRFGLGRDADVDAPPPAPPAAPRPAPAAAPSPPSWEQRSAAVLALTISLPGVDGSRATPYEAWTEAARWQRTISEMIEGFGGAVVERSQSRVTAVFGVPRALERLPQRVVQAAMAVRRAAASAGALQPDVRAAAHLAEVQVDVNSSGAALQLLPLGDAFALPERLLGHCGRGEILLSARLARRVERGFALVERQLAVGADEAERLTAMAVIGAATASAAPAGEEGAGFVGRARELELVGDAFARTVAGHGQVVFIAGEAGIGKSRLIGEFRRMLGDRPHRWIEGRCAPYGPDTSFLPLIDGLRRYADIRDDEDDRSAATKLAAEVARLGGELAWTAPYLEQLLSLNVGDPGLRDLDSASRRSELFRALRALIVRAAEMAPVVMVIEDLHWIDRASEEFLSFLADTVPMTRVLLLLSHRIGYVHAFGDRSYHTRITLAPLSAAEMANIASGLLGTAELPEGLQRLIAGKAEGNPFFVEELTKSLLEDGSLRRERGRVVLSGDPSQLTVPDTIQDILFARIDRLEAESRQAIQVASVIGREFAMRLLARITEAGDRVHAQVDELRSLELIYEKALSPELAFMFKHALTHDVAYESVVADRRRALHRTIGLAIEELYADRLAEHYETLALHFGRAEDWQRALPYYERSADKAADHYANRAAADLLRKALAVADRLGEQVDDAVRCRLEEKLGLISSYLSEYAAAATAYERAAEATPDAVRQALLLAQAAFNHIWAHQYDGARRCLEAGAAVAPEGTPGRALVYVVDGFKHAIIGESGAHETRVRAGLAICDAVPAPAVEAHAHFNLALNSEWRGAYDEAIVRAERSIALARQERLPAPLIFATWFLGKARCCIGDLGGALDLLREAHALCERIGDRAWRSRMLNTMGWCFAEIGAHDLAREHNERAAEIARQIGDPEIIANAHINLALNHLHQGDLDRALHYFEPIEASASAEDDPWMRWRYTLHVDDARAEIELARGACDAALAALDREVAGARRSASPKLEARALLGRGRVLLRMDARDEAGAALAAAAAVAERIGYRSGQWRALGAAAELATRAGQAAEAARLRAAAAEIVARLADSLRDATLRRRLQDTALA